MVLMLVALPLSSSSRRFGLSVVLLEADEFFLTGGPVNCYEVSNFVFLWNSEDRLVQHSIYYNAHVSN